MSTTLSLYSHEYFMNLALQEAEKAFDLGEIPVGAVVVWEKKVVGKGYNQVELLQDVTAHAEMLAITAASDTVGGKYLTQCSLYVTLEPCLMCAGAIAWSQLGQLVYGAQDEKKGFSKFQGPILHPKTHIIRGIEEVRCSELITKFFKSLREK